MTTGLWRPPPRSLWGRGQTREREPEKERIPISRSLARPCLFPLPFLTSECCRAWELVRIWMMPASNLTSHSAWSWSSASGPRARSCIRPSRLWSVAPAATQPKYFAAFSIIHTIPNPKLEERWNSRSINRHKFPMPKSNLNAIGKEAYLNMQGSRVVPGVQSLAKLNKLGGSVGGDVSAVQLGKQGPYLPRIILYFSLLGSIRMRPANSFRRLII